MSTIIFLQKNLYHDPFDAEGPVQPFERFNPASMVVSFRGYGKTGRHLPLAPDA
jgi:hypothetical protein